jgi:hypothetical protein
MTTLAHAVAATAGQIRQITRIGSDAIERVLEELGLDEEGAQRVHANGDEFAAAIRTAARASLLDLSISGRFRNEEVESIYVYPSEYEVRSITEQTRILHRLFPGIGFADETLAEGKLPKNAEGWFAIPNWEAIAPTYRLAVERVLAKLAETRALHNHRVGALGPEHLRQSDRTVQMSRTIRMMKRLGDMQKDHDLLVVAAQFGLRHRGRSVRRAREVFTSSEFGLGAFAVGIMTLTHPERFVRWEQLHTDCPGDEYSPDASDTFDFAPIFVFSDGKLQFATRWFDCPRDHCGSPSGFLPQE